MIWRFVLASASVIALTAASNAACSQTLTTCSQVNGGVGCCVQNVVHYCQSGVMKTLTCSGNQVCGWDARGQYYACVPSPPQSGGGQPMACPASK